MKRYLLDLNLLLALLDPQHVFHDAAHDWLEANSSARLLTCPLVQNGLIRVASQSAYPNALGTSGDVWEILAEFCSDPRHEFCPDNISMLDPVHLSDPTLLTPSRITDIYLLALARYHDATLATFDRRLPVDAVPEGANHIEWLGVP